MVDIFLEMSKKVGIFMIISQTVLHMGIAGTYEKYIRLVISFMVAAQIIFSFAAFFQIEDTGLFDFLEKNFQEEWKTELERFEEHLQVVQGKIYEKLGEDVQTKDVNRAGVRNTEKIQIGKIRIE